MDAPSILIGDDNFFHLGTVVEKVSPALEVDGLEAGMLAEADRAQQFRILVTTPEKLDLMLRGAWESKIGRPLTLVVVDEAHGLATPNRGIKLELLLATINRECRYAQFLLLTPFISNGPELARWLSPDSNKSIDDEAATDPVAAMTNCCRSVFGRLTQTASWGLSALQSLTLGNAFDALSPDEQRALRNLPARVYYGVNTDEAVALRLLGVPRAAAPALAKRLGVKAEEPLHQVRLRLRAADMSEWTQAMGERGTSYHRVWSIIEGER